jgi:hypothetical protein
MRGEYGVQLVAECVTAIPATGQEVYHLEQVLAQIVYLRALDGVELAHHARGLVLEELVDQSLQVPELGCLGAAEPRLFALLQGLRLRLPVSFATPIG